MNKKYTIHKYSVVVFYEEYGEKLSECIPDLWFIDELRSSFFFPPKTGKPYIQRAINCEKPDDNWNIYECTVVSSGFLTYHAGFKVVKEKCSQRYNTSSAEEEIQAANFRRQHPGLIGEGIEYIFSKPQPKMNEKYSDKTETSQRPTESEINKINGSKEKLNRHTPPKPNTSRSNSRQSAEHSTSNDVLIIGKSKAESQRQRQTKSLINTETTNGSQEIPKRRSPSRSRSSSVQSKARSSVRSISSNQSSSSRQRTHSIRPNSSRSRQSNEPSDVIKTKTTNESKERSKRRSPSRSKSLSVRSKARSSIRSIRSSQSSSGRDHSSDVIVRENLLVRSKSRSIHSNQSSSSRHRSSYSRFTRSRSHRSRSNESRSRSKRSSRSRSRSKRSSSSRSRSKRSSRSRSIQSRSSRSHSRLYKSTSKHKRSRSHFRSRRPRNRSGSHKRRTNGKSSKRIDINHKDITKVSNTKSSSHKIHSLVHQSHRPQPSRQHSRVRSPSSSNYSVKDLITTVKELTKAVERNNGKLTQNDRRWNRLEVTINKIFVTVGDMNGNILIPDEIDDPGFNVPELPIISKTDLSIVHRKLKDKEFRKFWLIKEKDYCCPSRKSTDNVTVTKYLKRFISVNVHAE